MNAPADRFLPGGRIALVTGGERGMGAALNPWGSLDALSESHHITDPTIVDDGGSTLHESVFP